MPIALPPEAVAVLESGRLHMRLLLTFELTGGATPETYRFTDEDGNIVWDGHEWMGTGQVASISARGFSVGTAAGGIAVQVNGAGLATEADPSGAALLATIVDEANRRDGVTIDRLFFDPVTAQPLFVLPFFDGYIARMPLRRQRGNGQGLEGVLVLELESDELMLDRAAGRYRSDADQRRTWTVGGGGLHMVVTTAASGGSVFWGQDAPNQNVATMPVVPGRGLIARTVGKLTRSV